MSHRALLQPGYPRGDGFVVVIAKSHAGRSSCRVGGADKLVKDPFTSESGRGPAIAVGRSKVQRVAHSRLGRVVQHAALLVGLLALVTIGCRRGVPVVDLSSKPTVAFGTISGTVRGPEGTSAIEGRSVEVVNVETGERQRTTTNNAGGFTVKVRPGRYRVQVALREGESIVKQPGVIRVNRSDLDAHADFVLGNARVSRPRFRTIQPDPGLGPPIA